MDLQEIRKRIKRLDYDVVKLLNQRMELALRSTRLRENPVDEEEEKDFRENIRNFADGLVDKEFLDILFDKVMSRNRHAQMQDRALIGFQGEHGANSEVAAKEYDSQLVPIPCMKFVDVFDGVKDGFFDFGVVPVENSLEGGVVEVNDLLAKYDLHIVGETKIHINHVLMTLPETDYRGIKEVFSHPQALAQCKGFIARQNFEARPYYNTAGAANMLAVTRPRASAVIANKLCADIYNLKILKEGIQDENSNITRFVILSKKPNETVGNKCSIVFTTPHECGALNKVLSILSGAGINLTRVESRPSRTEPGNFFFLVDFNGSTTDPKIAETLAAVEKSTIMFKLLGCYNEAQQPHFD